MKTLLITIPLLLPLLALQAEESPAEPESFATFWAHFESAVARNDKKAVAAATKFPFMKQLFEYHFLKDYPLYISEETQKCFATAKPVKETGYDHYIVSCGEDVFTFEKVNGGYKFADISMSAGERPPQPESFATFWTRFKSAVAKNDKEAIAAATKLPFMGQQTKAAFLKGHPSRFTKEVRKCFATAKPEKEKDDSYLVFCGEEIFYFEKVYGAYKFTDIGMND